MEFGRINRWLIEQFAAPLPEYYQRRVIFWQDEEREFDGRVEELVPL